MKCSGYRNVDQLRVNDESHAVKLKSLAASRSTPAVRPSLPAPLEDQARNAFFFHYVTHSLRTYSYLQSFYSIASPQACLSTSVDAVSLAFFSHWANYPLALDNAKRKYVSALQLVNDAIQTPHLVSRDATLLAAMLLDLFEKMTNRSPKSDGAWVSHVNGAFSLIQLRGHGQFLRPIGLQMLLRLCTNLLISCVASHRPIPSELLVLRANAACYIDSNNPKWRLMSLMVRFVELQQAHKNTTSPTRNICDLAASLDKDFCALETDMPLAWYPQTTYVDDKSEQVYGNRFESYGNVHITQTWNVLRLTRIFLNETIRDRCLQTQESSEHILPLNEIYSCYTTANQLIANLASEICASVPQYMGIRASVLTETPCYDSFSSYDSQGIDSSRSLQCYTLIFPLYVAARSAPSTSGIKEWALKQLSIMSNIFSLRNAEVVSKILRTGKDVDPWTVYATLGSYAFVA